MESRVPRTDQPELGPFGEVPNIECVEYREFKDGGGLAKLTMPFKRAGCVIRVENVGIRDPFNDLCSAYVTLPSEVFVIGSGQCYFKDLILRAVHRFHVGTDAAEHLVSHDPPSKNTENLIALGLIDPPISCKEYRSFPRGDSGTAHLSMFFDRSGLILHVEDVYIRDPNRDGSDREVRLPDDVTALGGDGKRKFDEAAIDAIDQYCDYHESDQ